VVGLVVKDEVSIGDLLTVATILLSLATLALSLRKDRLRSRRDYADAVRQAGAITVAALDRLRELLLRFFEDIQLCITEADVRLTTTGDVIATRDALWRALVEHRAIASGRVTAENIESIYATLYRYDPRVRDLFLETLRRMKSIDRRIYGDLLTETQTDVLGFQLVDPPFESAQLGNCLRASTHDLGLRCNAELEAAMLPYRSSILSLITSTDVAIYNRTTKGSTA
jgi:hypothetical protein